MTSQRKITADDIAKAASVRRWDLAFPDKIEQRFEADTAPRRARVLAAVAIRTVVVYNVFLVGDALLVPDTIGLSLIVHLMLVTPWLIVAAALFRRALTPRQRNLMILSIPLTIVAGILWVFMASHSPLASHYQYFVVLVVMYANSAMRPSFGYALTVSATIVIAHGLACVLHPDMPAAASVTASFGLLVTIGVTLIANYYIERDLRRLYLLRLKDNLAAESLQRTADDLTRMSHVDALTGLANRRGVDNRVAALFAGSPAALRPFAVLMIDVDHFKGFNDQYGHPAGDRCLTLIGAAVRGALRDNADILGRYGGEEFVAILPDADLIDGIRAAERMRRAVERLGVPHARSEVGCVTLSVGVGTGSLGDAASLTAAIVAADAALYEAKAAGRNRIRPALPGRLPEGKPAQAA
ncbi:GGDEF domain-containing protein [Phreatobacter stygius]|uniref:diguanylate cyclase n=1 Tax=Phreatobacter stygius TaxID=1940610 RepID=A0A4D7BJN3_9HYPH|nr:GGDEF domain-containing protein [Phreatobacter stygius]QCI67927.1 GGDEF domain-containing protein [Phreatobacter stygius]